MPSSTRGVVLEPLMHTRTHFAGWMWRPYDARLGKSLSMRACRDPIVDFHASTSSIKQAPSAGISSSTGPTVSWLIPERMSSSSLAKSNGDAVAPCLTPTFASIAWGGKGPPHGS